MNRLSCILKIVMDVVTMARLRRWNEARQKAAVQAAEIKAAIDKFKRNASQ